MTKILVMKHKTSGRVLELEIKPGNIKVFMVLENGRKVYTDDYRSLPKAVQSLQAEGYKSIKQYEVKED